MNNKNTDSQRRTLLKGIAMVPAAAAMGLLSSQAFAAVEMLSTQDPTAAALKYTETSTTEGQQCSNCALYNNGDEVAGDCTIFPGKKVAAAGWCASWITK